MKLPRTRSRILRPAGVLLAGLCLLSACRDATEIRSQEMRPSEQPNILFIVVDDMGMADLGSFGGEINTPHLDRLAYAGIRLTNFHAAPVCSVTRAMLLTGVDAHKAGLGNMAEEIAPNQQGQAGYEGYLNDNVVTLATLLKDQGYKTYLSGKWHLGMTAETSPKARGFERSFSLLSGGASHFPDMRPAYHPDPDGKAPYRQDGEMLSTLPDGFEYSSQYYVDQMIDFMAADQKADAPFFAYLAFTAPHWPLQADNATISKYEGRYDQGYEALLETRLNRQKSLGIIPADSTKNTAPPKWRDWEELSPQERQNEIRAMEIYAAMIDEIDVQTGKLINYLKSSDAFENTLIIFLSDNGAEGHDLDETWPAELFPDIRRNIETRHDFSFENMGKPGSYVLYGPNWARAGAPAYRMHKGYPTEGGTRVAAFVHYPPFNRGEISSEFMTVKDVVPTILDLLDISHPAPDYKGRAVEAVSGHSVLPLLSNGPSSPPRAPYAYGGETMGKYFIRRGNWKLVHMPPPAGHTQWALYNIADDPAETRDLFHSQTEIRDQLLLEWERYARDNNIILPDWVSGY